MTRAEFLKEKHTGYTDQGGSGDLIFDLIQIEKQQKKKAVSVLRNQKVILIFFKDLYVVTGADGFNNEIYFEFK